MIKDFLKKSKYYLLLLFIMGIIFYSINYFNNTFVMELDGKVMNFISNHIVKDNLTSFFKIITNLGSVYAFLIILFLMLLLIKNKSICYKTSFNLLLVYVISVIFKNIFRRERPIYSLITKPKDFSFPSGHTMCSVLFYGFLIYLINKHIKNPYIKYSIITLLIITILLIAFSRLYLNVHFFTDVLTGFLLGFICLRMCINYDKIKEK